jgi:uncharacterized protein RhaS with RHS repeats
MRARYYNPYLMRFINADPIGDSGGMTWYSYAGHRPLLYVDTSGLCPSTETSTYDKVSFWLHSTLSGLGTVPFFGVVPDAVDFLYTVGELPFGKSDWGDLGLSAVGIAATLAPGTGDVAATAAKIGKRTAKLASTPATKSATNVVSSTASTVGKKIPNTPGKPFFATNAAARQSAEKMGFSRVKDPPFGSHGQEVFKKGNTYISRDINGHNGGAWKMYDIKGNRIGTFNENLTIQIKN